MRTLEIYAKQRAKKIDSEAKRTKYDGVKRRERYEKEKIHRTCKSCKKVFQDRAMVLDHINQTDECYSIFPTSSSAPSGDTYETILGI